VIRPRARSGARARTSQQRGEAKKSFVRFVVGETLYAFEVEHVREILHRGPVTLLPHMPEEVAGVADHRGDVIPIVDLRLKFGMQEIPTSGSERRPEKWILVNSPLGIVGFVVDRVIDVVGTNESLGAPPLLGGQIDRGIKGVAAIDGALIFVLDVDRLSSSVKDLAPALDPESLADGSRI
jgi:purine-binding chemotaxis protein CheW